MKDVGATASQSPVVIDLKCGHENCKRHGWYELPVVCFNCGLRGTGRYTKGHEASRGRCPNCGTKQLSKLTSGGELPGEPGEAE